MPPGNASMRPLKQLGFVRNRQASALRGGPSGVIGLIVRDLTTPFYAELTAGLSEALESQGRMLFLLQGGRDETHLQRCLDTLLDQGVDGVVIAGGGGQGAMWLAQARKRGIPLLFASRASHHDEVDTVRPDNQQAARMLTEHLIRRGHQRIAWLGGASSSLTRAERLGGYCATLLQYGLPFHSEWVVECPPGQKPAAEAIAELLRLNPTITAVLCHNSTVAMGAWFGLMRAGRQSGEAGYESYFENSVTLAAFAEVPEDRLDEVPLTWVTTPAREMGHCVAERIMQRITHGDESAGSLILGPRLVAYR